MRPVTLVLGLAAAAAAQLVTTGASVKLGDVYYYVSPYARGRAHDGPLEVRNLPRSFGLTPVTVVSDPDVEAGALPGLFDAWADRDDVWQPGFLSTVLLASHPASPCLTKDSFHAGVRSLVLPLAGGRNASSSSASAIPPGPYFLDTRSGDVYPAYRLYVDFAGAFSEALLQAPDGASFQPLSAQVPASASLTVGVPSRLYFAAPSPARPLSGVRVGVKDIYDLAGARKSNGNRAWWSLYPPAARTAPAIQNLVDAGAVVVGYQKTSQFANGESPTADWVDYHAPFNPRGDGYNNPSSSSAGAGASVASYPWLDLAVGSDTGGSIRGPAGAQGIFGNRPSHGLVSLDAVMPLSPTLDTPGFLVRDPAVWDAANRAMYGDNYTSLADARDPAYPSTLLTMGFPGPATPAGRLLDDFAAALAALVGADPAPFNINDAWESSRPADAPAVSLATLLGNTYATLITKEQIPLVREPFYRDYAAAHAGRRPFVNPVPLSRWAWGDSVPDSWHADALRNKTLFMDWINDEVLPPSDDPVQCSRSIILYPGATGGASPRNRYSASVPGAPLGFSTSRISVFAEVPDSVFPLGEVPSLSSITGREELLPVAVNILVAKGCDGLIVRLAQDLVASGVLSIPKTGSTMAGADVLLRRELEHEMESWLESAF